MPDLQPKLCTLLAYSLALLVWAPSVAAIDVSSRLKTVGTWLRADQQDSVALQGLNPAYGLNFDARITLAGEIGRQSSHPASTGADSSGTANSVWRWELAGELTSLQGDVVENAALFGGQSSGETLSLVNDRRRAVNLTTNLSNGSRHALNLRLDRAQLVWQRNQWRVRAGRQALSLGSGRVFNPMDIFSPFAPTATDRDFKTGDDALVITRLGDTGSELEAIVVARRNSGDANPRADQGSYGLRFRTSWNTLDYELVAARHFDADVAMASLSGPLGGAVWRVNWVASHEDDTVTQSVVANLDYAFGFRSQVGYAFVEYYHNGYGNNRAADTLANVEDDAAERLLRGELFVLERNFVAAGVSLGLSPLLTTTTTGIVNLNDGAPLLQSALSYTAGNNLTIEGGAIVPLGGAGDEFGGVVVSESNGFSDEVLTGTSTQLYFRLVWFL